MLRFLIPVTLGTINFNYSAVCLYSESFMCAAGPEFSTVNTIYRYLIWIYEQIKDERGKRMDEFSIKNNFKFNCNKSFYFQQLITIFKYNDAVVCFCEAV